MTFEQPYQKLVVWQKADSFVNEIYTKTSNFPHEELYGVVSQLRRAALSIVLNIVEGQARGSSKDFARFIIMARGSCSECSYLLEFSYNRHYLSKEHYVVLETMRREINYLLQKLIRGLNS